MAQRSQRAQGCFSRDSPIGILALVSASLLGVHLCFVAFRILEGINGSEDYAALMSDGMQYGQSTLTNETVAPMCSLDFCAETPAERFFGRHELLYSYIVSIALAILYFWEHSPIHICIAMENVYRAMVILIACAATLLFERSTIQKSQSSGAIAMRQAHLLLLTTFLLTSFADIDKSIPGFFDRPCARRVLRQKRDVPPPRGLRVVSELNEIMLEVVGKDDGMSARTIGLLLFVFFMLEEIGLAFHHRVSDNFVFVADLFEFAMMIMLLRMAFWVLWTRRGHINQIQKLVAHFGRTDVEGLRYMLEHVSVGTLINLGGWKVQCSLMQAHEEGMLDTLSKAIIIDAFQKTGLHGYLEQCDVRDLLQSCHGNDLVTLKTLIDGSGGYYNLHKLIFTDLTYTAIREEILEHFASEATTLRNSSGDCLGIKVLSDVDDTLLSSGGRFPAGCHETFPRHVVYPGCLEFYRCLDKSFRLDRPMCNLVFLSARPHVFKDLAEKKSYQSFNELVSSGRMHSLPTLLAGTLFSGAWATIFAKCIGTSAWKFVGRDKYNTYRCFVRLYPEYDFVFCGDDGQGDLFAGQLMLEDDIAACRAVVIHRVLTNDKPLVADPLSGDSTTDDDESLRPEAHHARLHYHKCYVGAALGVHIADPDLVTRRSSGAQWQSV
eukprot:TRINITY_DN10651_c0_g1_i1.p1 TRINITY_DN10651_c0_g1~~TRINITY_DN10651_c0_g1_i1.p1  ORF type:complete len:675 (-),score=95.56 TRINITY_DN10651_c0_g1_i1:686-2674(-)